MAQHNAQDLAPWLTTFTADGELRPLPAVMADPATPESLILCRPLRQRAVLAAVISRAHKSPALIAHLVTNISESGRTLTGMENLLLTLLADPNVSEENIHAIAALGTHLSLSSTLLSAICAHPRANTRIIIDAIWRSAYSTAEQVAATTGMLLVAATNWVNARAERSIENRLWYADDAIETQILTTTHAWTTWAGTDPGRTAFLTTSSPSFTSENELLAAGAALTWPAAAT